MRGQSVRQNTKRPHSEHTAEAKGFFEAYAHLARNLRTWLLAYGVGGPVIFLTNDAAGRKLVGAGYAETVATLFLGGVALQIFAALLYKWALWFLYSGEVDKKFKAQRIYSLSEKVTDYAPLEIAFDIITVVFFLGATWLVLKATFGEVP